jgi:hypothetical protein
MTTTALASGRPLETMIEGAEVTRCCKRRGDLHGNKGVWIQARNEILDITALNGVSRGPLLSLLYLQ